MSRQNPIWERLHTHRHIKYVLPQNPQPSVHYFVVCLDHPKTPGLDYKSNSSCSSPSKDVKNSDRVGIPFGTQVPVLPVRNNLRRPNSTNHFSQASRFHFRKGLSSWCTWRCTAIIFIILSVVLTAALSYVSGKTKTTPSNVLVMMVMISCSVKPSQLVISKHESLHRPGGREFRGVSGLEGNHFRNEPVDVESTQAVVSRR